MSFTTTVICDVCETTKVELGARAAHCHHGPSDVPPGWVSLMMIREQPVEHESEDDDLPGEPIDVEGLCAEARKLAETTDWNTIRSGDVLDHADRFVQLLGFAPSAAMLLDVVPPPVGVGRGAWIKWSVTFLAGLDEQARATLVERVIAEGETNDGIIDGCFGDFGGGVFEHAEMVVCPSCIAERGAEVFGKLVQTAANEDHAPSGGIMVADGPMADTLSTLRARRRRRLVRKLQRGR